MRADRDVVMRNLKTARGQIEGLIKMVDDDRYCIDISNQILAVQAILRNTNKIILKAHLNGCVSEAVESGDRQKKTDEIVDLIDKLIK